MLHSIGKSRREDATRDPGDVVGRLVDCHARIREMLALALRLADEAQAGDEERVETAGRVRRYFRRALRLHVRDEEDSIAPRLAERSPELATALDRMRREHGEHDAPTAALITSCESIMEAPARWAELASELRARAVALGDALAPHLEEEERTIFPAITTHLDDETRARIVHEMGARRDADGERGRGRGGGGGGGGGRGRG